jgi:hypothetical protein
VDGYLPEISPLATSDDQSLRTGPICGRIPDRTATSMRNPRFVDHLDRATLAEVSALYGGLIPRGATVLDLMSSWHSHLPEDLEPSAVVGLGMNREELEANPVLTERLLHDLNEAPELPFDGGAFDAVICTVSVEYPWPAPTRGRQVRGPDPDLGSGLCRLGRTALTTDGVDPSGYCQRVAVRLGRTEDPAELEQMLDAMEWSLRGHGPRPPAPGGRPDGPSARVYRAEMGDLALKKAGGGPPSGERGGRR